METFKDPNVVLKLSTGFHQIDMITVKRQNKCALNKGRFFLKTTTAKFWPLFDDQTDHAEINNSGLHCPNFHAWVHFDNVKYTCKNQYNANLVLFKISKQIVTKVKLILRFLFRIIVG